MCIAQMHSTICEKIEKTHELTNKLFVFDLFEEPKNSSAQTVDAVIGRHFSLHLYIVVVVHVVVIIISTLVCNIPLGSWSTFVWLLLWFALNWVPCIMHHTTQWISFDDSIQVVDNNTNEIFNENRINNTGMFFASIFIVYNRKSKAATQNHSRFLISKIIHIVKNIADRDTQKNPYTYTICATHADTKHTKPSHWCTLMMCTRSICWL